MIPFIWNFRKDTFYLQWYKAAQRSPGTGLGRGTAAKVGGFIGTFGMMEIFYNLIMVWLHSHTFIKIHQTMHLKWVSKLYVKHKVWLKKTNFHRYTNTYTCIDTHTSISHCNNICFKTWKSRLKWLFIQWYVLISYFSILDEWVQIIFT